MTNDPNVTVVYKDKDGNVIDGVPTDAGERTTEITAKQDSMSDEPTATVIVTRRS